MDSNNSSTKPPLYSKNIKATRKYLGSSLYVNYIKKMTELITDKTEIYTIITEKIKGKKLIFTTHYRIGIAQRGIAHEKVLEVFPQFEKVKAIEKKTIKFGDIGYELFYDFGSDITFSIATCTQEKKLFIIHAIEYKRSLGKRFIGL